jgi:ribose 5-phosphate isomerase B
MEKYFVASDHAGFAVKEFIVNYLKDKGIEAVDEGPANTDRVDYPDFASKVSQSVMKDLTNHKGILICGTGIGMSMSANKHDGIRAALCHDAYGAKMAREHNDANILCMGERVSGLGEMESILESWLASEFAGGRHAGRVGKINLMGGCR